MLRVSGKYNVIVYMWVPSHGVPTLVGLPAFRQSANEILSYDISRDSDFIWCELTILDSHHIIRMSRSWKKSLEALQAVSRGISTSSAAAKACPSETVGAVSAAHRIDGSKTLQVRSPTRHRAIDVSMTVSRR